MYEGTRQVSISVVWKLFRSDALKMIFKMGLRCLIKGFMLLCFVVLSSFRNEKQTLEGNLDVCALVSAHLVNCYTNCRVDSFC